MTTSDHNINISDHTNWIVTGAIIAIITSLVFHQTRLEIGTSLETTRTLLNSLAISQSSAVAIVASVTLLNVQLVADRYSTELVRSSLRSSSFKKILSTFIASIAFDLILVYNIEHYSTGWFTIAVVSVSAWAAINAFVLYQFIFNSVGVLTPSSLITTITRYEPVELANRTSPVSDISNELDPKESGGQEKPLYQLYVIISSSIGTVDYNVVKKGLRELHTLLEQAITGLEQSKGEKVCQNAFQLYYPRIISQCIENDEIDQAEKAVEDLTDLLKTLETDTEDWYDAHFTGIQALFRIRDENKNNTLIDDETILSRLKHFTGSYWTASRLEYVLSHAETELVQEGRQDFFENLISSTHAGVINSKQTKDDKMATDPVELWEQETGKVLTNVVRTFRAADPQESRQFLELWPQLYGRSMSDLGSHREWLVTIIFELTIFHVAHHTDEYTEGKNTILDTLRAAQPEITRQKIETLQKVSEQQVQRRNGVAILSITNNKGQIETAYQHRSLAENMVSEAIDMYRQGSWNTDKAVEFIRNQPSVIGDQVDCCRFMSSPANAEYTLISDPETADGQIIKLVISEEINSDLVESLSFDGVSRYICIGPVVTGDFTAPQLEIIRRSLPELRPLAQTSLYDYYNWA
ncbi:DUF2254 family protein [Halorubrum sp. Ea8]|uniref:DUF2254 family protein n=1 Tax=Halorubrum sp. Ea8 TaxID=1383841 RepID=UPI0015959569|nr:DUF2254 family protein [Halorubrum sp. Ea8]